MGIHIQRDDGQWLVGPGSTRVADKPEYAWRDLAAAMAAINRYRLSCAVFCAGKGKDDGFTFFHVN